MSRLVMGDIGGPTSEGVRRAEHARDPAVSPVDGKRRGAPGPGLAYCQ
jgi:hypothetical protein